MKKNKMKVLIFSHNPISTNNNMGKTMFTLFSMFEKEELCQFYIYPTLPDVDKCASYYRLTDKDVLKSYYKFKLRGKVINSEDINANEHKVFEDEKDERLYRDKKNKFPFRLLARDLMWKLSHWYNKNFKNWINEQKPTHIFIAPGTSKFIYDIALKVSKKYNIPLITYICDDYFFVKKANSLLGRIQQRLLHKKIKKLMRKTQEIITICSNLNSLYGDYFGLPTTTVMTGTNYNIESEPIKYSEINSLTYMGNIRCNRYISLAKIGRALDNINQEMNTSITLDIYSAEKDPVILDTFRDVKSVKFCGFLSGAEFDKKFHKCEMLIHTEDFSSESIDLVKNSVSTKIADSLGSGICLFAFAPKEVASMQYLIENDCAVCCDDEKKLERSLKFALFNNVERERVVLNAIKTANKNHELIAVGNKVKEIFERISYVDNQNGFNN